MVTVSAVVCLGLGEMGGQRPTRLGRRQNRARSVENLAEPLRIGEREPGRSPLRANVDQSTFAQAGEVLTDRRLGESNVFDKVAHPVRPGRKVVQNRDPIPVCEGVEESRVDIRSLFI